MCLFQIWHSTLVRPQQRCPSSPVACGSAMFGYRNPRQNTRRRRGTVFRTLVPRAAIALTPTRSPPQLACGHAKPIRATKKDGSITPLHPAIFISHRNRSAGVKKSPCPLFGTLMPFTDKVKGGSLFAPPPPAYVKSASWLRQLGEPLLE